MKIVIDGNEYEVNDVNDWDYIQIETDDGDFAIFKSNEDAGEKAREYWQDMVENDKDEFVAIVGTDALVSWALGQNYAVGSVGVSSLDEWLDLWLDAPEEHFASYDGNECQIDFISRDLLRELYDDVEWIEAIRDGYAVAYRQN